MLSFPCCLIPAVGLQPAGLGEGPGWTSSPANARFHPTELCEDSEKSKRSSPGPFPFLLVSVRGGGIWLWAGVVSTATGLLAPADFSSALFALQSRKHASKVRLYYMLHPVDGGCPAKKLRSENVGTIRVLVCPAAL